MTPDPERKSELSDKPPAFDAEIVDSSSGDQVGKTDSPEMPREQEIANQPTRPTTADSRVPAPVAEVVDAEIIHADIIVADVVDAIAISPPLSKPQAVKVTDEAPPSIPDSPFATTPPPHAVEAPIAERFESYTARGAATSAIALGILALLVSWFSIVGLFPAALGFMMGIWGTTSHFKRRAVIGMLISLVAGGLTLSIAALKPSLLGS